MGGTCSGIKRKGGRNGRKEAVSYKHGHGHLQTSKPDPTPVPSETKTIKTVGDDESTAAPLAGVVSLSVKIGAPVADVPCTGEGGGGG